MINSPRHGLYFKQCMPCFVGTGRVSEAVPVSALATKPVTQAQVDAANAKRREIRRRLAEIGTNY